MATDRCLPDTCAWIDFFNGRQTPLAVTLERILREGEAYTCGAVKYELVQGVKTDREERALLDALKAVTHLELNEALWIKAGRLSGKKRKQGVTLPFSDLLIAVLALEHGLTVLSTDPHFGQVEGVKMITGD
jgi:predicted nucleic acid-binding protein